MEMVQDTLLCDSQVLVNFTGEKSMSKGLYSFSSAAVKDVLLTGQGENS